MRFWGSPKRDEGKNCTQPHGQFPVTEKITPSEYQYLWMLLCVTFTQVLPRINLNLCLNESGELALMALPDAMVSMTWGKVSKHPRPGVVLVQRIDHGEDKSYLSPITYTDKHLSCLKDASSFFNRGELRQWLKKYDWRKLMSEIKANNSAYLNGPSYRQEVSRIKIQENADPKDSDDSQTLPGYDGKIPIFLYTEPHSQIEMNRDRLHREIFLRKYMSDNKIKDVRKNVNTLRPAGNLQDNETLAYVISRVETELQLNSSEARPPFADIMLDPEMTKFDDSLSKLIFTPKGIQASEEKMKSWAEKTGFSMTNWQEPDIVHTALHIMQLNGQSLKQSVTSPASTVFRDRMGIHALQSWLFRMNTKSFSLGVYTSGPVILDDIPTPQIPDISWKPISEKLLSEWWQTDAITKKVMWLATQNLASHLVGNPEEVVCSVTPIGNDVIQISMLFDNLEAGAPYAFAIIRDFAFGTATVGDTTIHFGVAAIPIFSTGTWESQPDGSLIATKGVLLKNYIITTEGERIQDNYFITTKGERIKGTGIIMQFTGPIYSSVMSGKYKEPKFYEVGRP